MIKSINKLVKQNKTMLAEHCTGKYFKDIRTMEEALIEVFSHKEIKKYLKTYCVPEIKVKHKISGEFVISFVLASDESLDKSPLAVIKQHLSGLC